ncbi:hypothetical protein I4U23_025283 [Adineta vaga]|nr:hypothetical protein I4U23_025283 [Adineta vaga]
MLGFKAKNLENIDQQYKCKICSRILRNPVQLKCGHRQCKSCVEYSLQAERLKCPECSQETHQNEIRPDKGAKNDMKVLEIFCSYCDWNGSFREYETHLQQAHTNPICEYCNKSFDSINNLELHQAKDCSEITIPCALKDYGCTTFVRQVDMLGHYKSMEHQMAVIAFIRRDASKFMGDRMDIDNFFHTTTYSSEHHHAQLEEVCETIDILASGVETLNEDSKRLHNESVQLNNAIDLINKECAVIKLSIQEQNAYLDGLKPSQDILHQEIVSLQQKVEDSQAVSYDGTYTWKVSNYQEKMADAQSERQTSIYSPPFYSSPTGYKMRARLYLYGDGNARRTHISLFFVLMRSDYDAILRFPFNYKVTFCLFDQTPAQKHIIDSFRPDIKSNSFQRPRSEMNIASGIPKFFPLDQFQAEGNPYVRDDTLFIKILVDFSDIPKAILPFALSLNPGLPINVHHSLVKKESERRTQQTSNSTASSMSTELLVPKVEQ